MTKNSIGLMLSYRQMCAFCISLTLCLTVVFLSGCSPGYVIRAGWEEAGILYRRTPIDDVLANPDTSVDLRTMLHEVRRARGFAEQLGLQPNDSFHYYSQVDRDVLVWVLSAAPKDELKFKTWWFPIVGRVPYKGFFNKEDGLAESKKLANSGYDAYLRPSLAFSTLGWFSDPVLSTMLQVDSISLVDTVFHELLHNTIWLPGHVEFNESLANAVGSFAAREYFANFYSPMHPYYTEALHRWEDEVRYSIFLTVVCEELRKLYSEIANHDSIEKTRLRDVFFEVLNERWSKEQSVYRSQRYTRLKFEKNNAALLAQTIYLSKLDQFNDVFLAKNKNIPEFLSEMRALVEESKSEDTDPFELLTRVRDRLVASNQHREKPEDTEGNP